MNEHDTGGDYPQVDTSPTEHEREVADEEPAEEDAADDRVRRPTAEEDLAADKGLEVDDDR